MTMLLVMEEIESGKLKYSDLVTASAYAKSMGGSTIFLDEGEKITVEDLLKGIVVSSGNDACVAIAEHICGNEDTFVQRMNTRAFELGMKNTNFTNCNGLDEENHYSSAYDISSVTLTENFSPLVGLNMTMKNSLSAKFEYRKQRNISLNVNSVQITEGHTDEFVVGAGYTIKDLSFITKNRNGGQKKVSNDLKLNVDVSYKDIKTLLRKVEEDLTQASSGNKVFGIKISADYVLSQKINLQFFYDHQGTTPLISSSYPIKSDNVGINIKLMLTRDSN